MDFFSPPPTICSLARNRKLKEKALLIIQTQNVKYNSDHSDILHFHMEPKQTDQQKVMQRKCKQFRRAIESLREQERATERAGQRARESQKEPDSEPERLTSHLKHTYTSTLFCCKTVKYNSVLLRNIKIRFFLLRNVKIRAMSRKNCINCAASCGD